MQYSLFLLSLFLTLGASPATAQVADPKQHYVDSLHIADSIRVSRYKFLRDSMQRREAQIRSRDSLVRLRDLGRLSPDDSAKFVSDEKKQIIRWGMGQNSHFVSVGGGLNFSLRENSEYEGMLIVSYRLGQHVLTARATAGYGSDPHILPSESINDFSLLYGRQFNHDLFISTVSAGVGLVAHTGRGDLLVVTNGVTHYAETNKITPGIAWQAQLIRMLSKDIGVGLTVLGDVNLVKNYVALMLALHFFEF